eukprot:g6888.t1
MRIKRICECSGDPQTWFTLTVCGNTIVQTSPESDFALTLPTIDDLYFIADEPINGSKGYEVTSRYSFLSRTYREPEGGPENRVEYQVELGNIDRTSCPVQIDQSPTTNVNPSSTAEASPPPETDVNRLPTVQETPSQDTPLSGRKLFQTVQKNSENAIMVYM